MAAPCPNKTLYENRVTLCTSIGVGGDHNHWLCEIFGWIQDASRAGRFTYCWLTPDVGAFRHTRMMVTFSDPDVALEFKMRFG